MLVNQISIGRFHHFHLARQLEKRGLLDNIWTGYPSFKLEGEQGISKNKIKTFPWIHAPYMARSKFGLSNWNRLNKAWEWLDRETLDKYVAHNLNEPCVVFALSSSGLHSGLKNQMLGGKYICDRGSSHIRYQNQILTEEYHRWGFKFSGIDPRVIEKEELEYLVSDLITVPSEFARTSFIEHGINPNKIIKVPYGANLDRFCKVSEPNKNKFRVLWVGAVSFQKGFFYALEAFNKLKVENKEFVVVGVIEPQLKTILMKMKIDKVIFKGVVPNYLLPKLYSSANVFILTSIQEGLAMVQGEALACGCPIIASKNTGSEDLFTDGEEGFIVPIRSSEAILEKLYLLADDEVLRQTMSNNALKKVKSLGGWDKYGDQIAEVLHQLQNSKV